MSSEHEKHAKYLAAIKALMVHGHQDAACEHIGITVRTLQRWRNDPDFVHLQRSFYRDAIRDVAGYIIGVQMEAVNALLDVMRTTDKPGVKIRAATAVLQHWQPAGSFVALDEDLEAIENANIPVNP